MSSNAPAQLVFYTRPWQVDFHVKLARALQEHFGQVPVSFVTFFSWVRCALQDAGLPCVYVPDELNAVTGREVTPSRVAEIDRTLFAEEGVNFNVMLQSERFLPADGRLVELFGLKHLAVLDRIVVERTLSISTMYDHFFYWLAGALANSRNGQHFAFTPCGIPPNRVLALKRPWETWSVPFEGDAEALLVECRSQLHVPAEDRLEYMRPQPVPPLWKRLRTRYREVRCEEEDRNAGSYFPGTRLFSLNTIRNRLPQRWFRYPEPTYDISSIGELHTVTGDTCYLPLHMEPEATILMFSPWLRDQLEVCRLVSQAMPVGWRLLVKENPKMVGMREPAFYRRLRGIPNVLLVSPGLDSTALTTKCRAVASLAGTASREAAILNKPAIVLGRPPGLGLFTAGDVSADGLLSRLFELIQREDTRIDGRQWLAWLSGSFDGSVVPVFDADGVMRTPSDDKNVEAYANYIVAALRHDGRPCSDDEFQKRSTPSRAYTFTKETLDAG